MAPEAAPFAQPDDDDLTSPRTGVWRVRVRLTDHPGALAAVTSRLSDHGCNVLGLSVLPVGPERPGGPHVVVDEIVLAAPARFTTAELTALVTATDAECIGIVSASVHELVDTPTSALRDAAGVLAGAVSIADAVGRLLAAESIECTPRLSAAEEDPVTVDQRGHRARVAVDGSTVTVTRSWAPFTDLELARVTALVDLIASSPLPAGPPPALPARRQLSALDVQFLNAETAKASTHIGSLTVLDPSCRPGGPITIGELRRLIGSRLHIVAPLRWKLHKVPFGLDRPYWLDSGAVDMMRHVHEVSVEAPGTDEQLGELVSDLAAQPLDRSRPMWQAYLIHGLSGGRQALYTKVHHSVIDGVSGAEILAVVLDLSPTPRRVPRAPSVVFPEPAPSLGEMTVRSAHNRVRSLARVVRATPGIVAHLTDLPGSGSVPLAGAFAVASRSPKPNRAPRTLLNRKVSEERAFAFSSLPLDEVKAVRKALGLTVNDVVMAMCTTALRRWLSEHESLPSGPVVAGIPVSVRTPAEFGTAGNHISFLITPLPTNLADPMRRVQVLRADLADGKRRIAGAPVKLLEDAAMMLPQVLDGIVPRALLAASRVVPPPVNLLVSNVPGPQLTLYAAGAKVLSNHPVSVISDVTGGMNITVMSYDGHLDVGILACRKTVPDVWRIADYLRDALDELLAEIPGATDERAVRV